MEALPKVAVIGMGKIGTVLATNLVKGSRAVIVADRTAAKSEALAKSLGKLATARDVNSAIKEADLVILAVWYETIKEFLNTYSVELQGKIIIDPSNPLTLAEGGGFKKIIDQDQSAGQLLSALLPKGARLVKAFASLSAETLSNKAFQQPERAVIFYASDDTSVKDQIETLIRAAGFEPLGLGGISQSIRIEAFGDLAEYGGLGRTVTLAEAREKIFHMEWRIE
jgi:predicted dinucleotide-binding enzyme